MPELPELTSRQRDVLLFIEGRIEHWGYPPTVREIGEHFGIRSTNGVADHLKALKRKGYLTQQNMKSRTLKPTSPGSNQDTTVRTLVPASGDHVSIPILGRVAAGEPILAEEHAEGSVVVDAFLVGKSKKLFALKVVGESMINDGIFDGDYIFVQKRAHAERGAIVVVMIDDAATVKRYYPEADHIRLQPANDAMEPIVIKRSDFRETQILGIVAGVYRRC